MAETTHGCIAIALLLTALILETVYFSDAVLQVHSEEEHFASPAREKRSALLTPVEYTVEVELNVSDIRVVDQLRILLQHGPTLLSLGPNVTATHIDITTVCYLNGTNFQCRCEEQYVWSHNNCMKYGACDEMIGETCGCISSIPTDGQHCQPNTPPPLVYEYLLSIELNTTGVAVIDRLRSIPYPIIITDTILVSDLNISTVCYPNSTGYQCRCEDQYRWSCDQCFMYGTCDNITDDTCGCISDIPPDGQHCQSAEQHNFTSCPPTTASPSPTTPPLVYEYLLSIELNTTDVAVIDRLRSIPYPIIITDTILVSDLNISTVCYPNSTGYQCRCEDQYRWSCDQCFMYGTCDNITDDTCGCISDIPPDGQHCQSAEQHNFTSCPPTTASPSPTTPPLVYEYLLSIELNTTDVAVIDRLRSIPYPIIITDTILVSDLNISTVCYPNSTGYQCRCEDQYRWSCDQCFMYGTCDNITDDTCGCISDIPPDGQHCQSAEQHNFTSCPPTTASPSPTTPPLVYEYLLSIELNTTDVAVIDRLRSIPYPIIITDTILVSDLNISTVCYPNSTGYQCRCEDQYRWSCDQCFMYGTCDNITDDTCGCISDIPPDGQHCQSAEQPNFRSCPYTTTPKRTNSTTTVSTPTTFVTNSTTAFNTTATTNTTNSTTTVSTPTTFVTNSTIAFNTTATTNTTNSTTTVSTPTTFVTRLNVEMSIELNATFNDNLNNELSDEYKTLESSINKVLVNQYKRITGFLGVFVTGFREGSVITEFTVQTTNIIVSEVATANKELINAMESIAPVIGSVTATFNSKIPVKLLNPSAILTGETMTLICEVSDDLIVGDISGSTWKFNGRKINTNQVSFSGSTSTLKVNNAVLLDKGFYECTLMAGIISYSQKRTVTNIEQAPIIRLKRQVNVKCETGEVKSIECCVQSPYTVNWFSGTEPLPHDPPTSDGCIKYDYRIRSCSNQPVFTCKVKNQTYEAQTRISVFTEDVACMDSLYGDGREDDESTVGCKPGLEGFRRARCVSRKWTLLEDTCIVTRVKELLFASERLNEETVAAFATNLSIAVREEQANILSSPATISAIVDILENIAAHIGSVVSGDVLKDVLTTVDVIIGDDARESWKTLNANETRNASSSLLGSMELLAGGLVEEVAFATQSILLNRTSFNNSFRADLNSSIIIDIADINLPNVFITTITFLTLNNVMPVRNSSSIINTNGNDSRVVDTVNAAVVLVQINETIQNVTLSYRKLNNSLSQGPQCVFWNFTLLNSLGAWDNKGCAIVSNKNNTVTCNCNHLTSFSILMATNIPAGSKFALDVITYVGVGISLASLVICLIIEGYVWKAMTRNSTSFMRHVSIVNSALSLLIANICFIIGASIADNPLENPGGNHSVPVGPCSTATFFMHFFYLALFFWMLVSGLLLFYRTVMVFSHMSKSTMLAIGFVLGYGCPLIIAVITVAVTAPEKGYIRKENACWLNWTETRALLAMVIPALTIVSINILIVFVVVFKMLRRGVGDAAQAEERHTVVVILRCVVILTPLFGLTWALGVGTMIDSENIGIHIAFAFFNSLQGFFILVFGTLFDSRIRSILLKKIPTSSTGSNHTSRTTSGGLSFPSGLNWINRLRQKRNVYHVSGAATSSSTGASESFINT